MENEPLMPLQENNIRAAVKKLYKTEKIVNYDLDFSKWEIVDSVVFRHIKL